MIFVFTFLASVNGPAQDAWNITAQMTVGRYFFESQALNDYQVLIIGGMSGTGVTASVEYYDARTKSCTQVAPMREPRYAFASVRLPDGQIWVCGGGGKGGGVNSKSIEIFDPKTNIWSSGGNLLYGRWQHSALLINDHEILIVGGRNGRTECEVYDVSTKRGRTVASFPYINTFGKLLLSGSNEILAFSGRVDGPESFRTETIHRYDIASNTWVVAGTMCFKMYYPSVTQLVDRSIFLTGGSFAETNAGGSFSTDIQQLSGSSFQCMGNMRYERAGHSTIQYGQDRLLVIGGMNNASVSYTSCEFVDVATGQSTMAPSLNNERRYFRSVMLLDAANVPVAVAIGGQQNSGATSSIEELSECTGGDRTVNLASDDVILVGSSAQSTPGIQLTSALTYQAGAAWMRDRVSVAGGFDISFSFRIANGNDNDQIDGGPQGADGIALVIQNENATALGKPGDGIGYNEIPHGIAIEFDSYLNAAFTDPSGSHIAVQVGDGAILRPWHVPPYLKGITTTGFPPFVADGSVYYARVTLEGTMLKVYCSKYSINNTPALVVEGINISELLRLGQDGAAWIGFTSSTGFASEIHELLSLQLSGCRSLVSTVAGEFNAPAISSPMILPTPSQDAAVLKVPTSAQCDQWCTVYDLRGNAALSFVLPAGSCDVTIPLLTLGNGAYRMLVKDIKGVYSVPLIIAR